MENYDYYDAVKNDVLEYIQDSEVFNDFDLEDFERLDGEAQNYGEDLYDTLWIEDSVTGNASGSYTFSSYDAEENLVHNMDLLQEACENFGQDMGEAVKRGPEYCDVTIRCYLLSEAVTQVLDEIQPEFEQLYANAIEDHIRNSIDDNVALSPEEKQAALNSLEEKMKKYPDEIISDYNTGDLDVSDCIADGLSQIPEKESEKSIGQPEKEGAR